MVNIIDGKDLKLSDIDFEFIATKAGNKNKPLNPERWLVRYQLMEIFVRIALHKFFKTQKEVTDPATKLTESGSIMKLFNEYLLGQFKKYDCNKWRVEKLWTKTNDEIIKSHLKTIKRLYEMYSGKHTLPGKTKFTSLDEFMVMISNSGILKSGSIGAGEIGSMFNISMMTQVDELDNTRHMEMTMIEFIEAICRVGSYFIRVLKFCYL